MTGLTLRVWGAHLHHQRRTATTFSDGGLRKSLRGSSSARVELVAGAEIELAENCLIAAKSRACC